MMKREACQYAIVRYSPFVETGEFANIGIVLFTPAINLFAFKLVEKRYARITNFFDDVNAKMFKAATSNLKEELLRIEKLVQSNQTHFRGEGNSLKNAIFDEVLRTRESIARYSEKRTVLTDDPKAKLEELFQYYVERNFATKEYRETILEKDVRRLLFQNHLIDKFSAGKIGNSEYEVPFPFVENYNNEVRKVIKPLNLTQSEPSKILEHGGKWEFRIRELKRRKTLPKKVLFTIEAPTESGHRTKAYKDVMMMLKELGVETAAHNDKEQILKFAAK